MTLFYTLILTLLYACQPKPTHSSQQNNPHQQQLKEYWYNGEAELTSYQLRQARYGEIREGKAVLIFVTEDFSPQTMTKADQDAPDNISVLKLNNTRKFITGVYPYSMMTSTFFPFPNGENSVKISTSSQEWCGHTYLELSENESQFDIYNASYFQSEAKKEIKLEKALLEDDLWSLIRLNPDNLPLGSQEIIPSFFYLRVSHNDIRPYQADLKITSTGDSSKTYIINYPELERRVHITFASQFPFKILGWEETYYSGWGDSRKKLTTSGALIKSIRSQYWNHNTVADSVWRGNLGLK